MIAVVKELEHGFHLEIEYYMWHPIAFYTEIMGDFIHMHQTLHYPDGPEFIKATTDEVNAHVEKKRWVLIK